MRQDKLGRLWLEWALATMVGYGVGTLAVLPFAVQLAYAAQPAWLVGAVGGAVLGIAIGGAQWLVLRRHGLAAGGWWVLASLVGAAIGLALGTALADSLAPAAARPPDRETAARLALVQAAISAGVTGAVFGLAVGAAQWLVLRAPGGLSAWWIAANGLGWMAALGLGAALAEQVTVLGALVPAGAAAGVITGLALQRWAGRVQTGQK